VCCFWFQKYFFEVIFISSHFEFWNSSLFFFVPLNPVFTIHTLEKMLTLLERQKQIFRVNKNFTEKYKTFKYFKEHYFIYLIDPTRISLFDRPNTFLSCAASRRG